MSKRIQFSKTGGAEVLEWVEVEPAAPAAGEVRIANKAVGLNFIDIYFRTGLYPAPAMPSGLGTEGAGTVDAVGEGVTHLKVGDRVAYAMHTGSYAEQAAVPSWLLVELPDQMDFATCSAAMLQGMTAHFLVFGITRLNPGDRALVHAGAGGMGLLLIQMLKRLGAEVFTTVSTESKAQLAKDAGADNVILYTQQDFEEEVKKATGGEGVRIVYDAVGQTTFEKGLNCLGRRGYMALYGQASGPVGHFDSGAIRNGSCFLTRPSLGDYTATREELLQRANEVLGWVGSGELKLHVSQTLPLEHAVEAHRQLEGRQSTGKILLTP